MLNFDDLIKESWKMYAKFENQTPRMIVVPSIPILFFGDSEKYITSGIKAITVGLNPSNLEFPGGHSFSRFSEAQYIFPQILEGKHFDKYLSALNSYFRIEPYKKWFNSFEPILNGLKTSYYGCHENVALHTDLCSPLATTPSWSKIKNKNAREELEQWGRKLWHDLLRVLKPDIVIVSIADKYMGKIENVEKWEPLCIVKSTKAGRERRHPFIVKLAPIKIADKSSLIVFGKAAQTPFGTLSERQKREVGRQIGESLFT